MRDYTKDQAKAAASIRKYSTPGHIKIVRAGDVFDPIEGTITGTGSVVDVNAVNLDVKESYVNGTTILASDNMVMMDAAVKPDGGDSIRIGGKDYKIIDIMPFSPGGVDIYYEVICRG